MQVHAPKLKVLWSVLNFVNGYDHNIFFREFVKKICIQTFIRIIYPSDKNCKVMMNLLKKGQGGRFSLKKIWTQSLKRNTGTLQASLQGAHRMRAAFSMGRKFWKKYMFFCTVIIFTYILKFTDWGREIWQKIYVYYTLLIMDYTSDFSIIT